MERFEVARQQRLFCCPERPVRRYYPSLSCGASLLPFSHVSLLFNPQYRGYTHATIPILNAQNSFTGKGDDRGEKARYIRWFDEISIDDVPLVGWKNASLGEMYRELSTSGIKIPNGFAVTADAYRYLVEASGKLPEIQKILGDIDKRDLHAFAKKGHRLRELIYQAPLPQDLCTEIGTAYRRLCEEYGDDTDVAIRSSATAEDLPTASFAGQQESYLNIRGNAQLLDDCRRCFASLFTDRAISYRIDQGFDHFRVALSIGVPFRVEPGRTSRS